MRILIRLVTWTLIGAAFAFVAGSILGAIAGPAGTTGGEHPIVLGAKAAVQGAIIGFFIGTVVPSLFEKEDEQKNP